MIPLAYLAIRIAEADGSEVWSALARERTVSLALTSFTLALTVAIGCLALGIPTAWALTRVRLPFTGLWRVLATLPLAVPSYLTAFAWLSLWPGTNGFWPLVGVLVLACTPYVTLPVAAAFSLADRRAVDAARTLGRGPLGAFRAATVPQIAPAAAAGALLAALYTVSDFGSPALFRVQTLTSAVFAAYEGGLNRTLAAVIAAVLVVLALSFVGCERIARRLATRGGRPGSRLVRSPPQSDRATRVVACVGLGAIAVAGIGVPGYAIARRAATGRAADVDWPRLIESAWSTLGFSLGGAVIAVALGLPVAVLAARYRGRLTSAMESVVYVANGIPGLVVGLSLVFFTLNVVPVLYQTALALCLAYAVIFLPRAVGSARTAIDQVPVELEEVSRTLGRGPFATWSSVTARLSAPGIAAGGLLVTVTAMKELPATLMLIPTGSRTLATELWRHTSMAAYSSAVPYAIALVVVASIPAYLLSRPERHATRR